jgi:hypothetical protein
MAHTKFTEKRCWKYLKQEVVPTNNTEAHNNQVKDV